MQSTGTYEVTNSAKTWLYWLGMIPALQFEWQGELRIDQYSYLLSYAEDMVDACVVHIWAPINHNCDCVSGLYEAIFVYESVFRKWF